MEKYTGQNNGTTDTTYRHYDYSMRDIHFSLAPNIDRKYGTKLIKIVYIYNPKDTGAIKSNRDVFYSEIVRSKIQKPEQIKQLMSRFNAEKQKIKLD